MTRPDTWFRWLGPPLIGGTAYGALYLLSQFEPERFLWVALLYYVLLAAAMYEGSTVIARRLDGCFPWAAGVGRRLIVQLPTTLTYALLVTLASYAALKLLLIWLLHQPDQLNIHHLLLEAAFGLLIGLVVNSGQLGLGFLRFWQHERLRAERWQQETTRAQFAALKDQVNPHFLFNSLNILSELIDAEPGAAKQFVDKLAEVYRYVLRSRDIELIALSEELAFVQAYAFLLRQRFGEALRIDIEVPPTVRARCLPPLALQLLLENAIKHNAATRRNPLTIRLRVEAGQLLVSNNRQPRPDAGPPSGLGLLNIRKRYEFLSDQLPVIEPGAAQFLVRLPLLPAPDLFPAPLAAPLA